MRPARAWHNSSMFGSFRPSTFSLRRLSRWLARLGVYAFLLLAFVFAAGLTTAYLWLPSLTSDAAYLERTINARSRHPVKIAASRPYWEGWFPGVELDQVQVQVGANDTKPLLKAARVRATLAWWPLLAGKVRAHRIELSEASTALERRVDGSLGVVGLASRAGDENSALERLLSQEVLEVRAAKVEWIDRFAKQAPQVFGPFDVSLNNSGAVHRLKVSLDQAALCEDCHVDFTFSAAPRGQFQAGVLRLGTKRLYAATLPAIAKAAIPLPVDAKLTGNLMLSWSAEVLERVQVDAVVADMRVADNAKTRAFELERVAGRALWTRAADGWDFEARDIELVQDKEVRVQGVVEVAREGDSARAVIEILDVALIDTALRKFKSKAEGIRIARALRLRGQARDVQASVQGAFSAPQSFRVEADIDKFAMAPWYHVPGIRGASGHIVLDQTGGEATIESYAGTLDFPRVFDAPLPIDEGSGVVSWRRHGWGWEIKGDTLTARNVDGQAQGRFALRIMPEGEPRLFVEAQASEVDLRRAPRYYPRRMLSAKTLAWLDPLVQGGRVARAAVFIDGPLFQFPYGNDRGRFSAQLQVQNGVVQLRRDWPRLDKLQADVRFAQDDLHISGRGALRDLALEGAVFELREMQTDPAVSLHGELAGPVGTKLALAREVLGPSLANLLPPDLRASGHGRLGVNLGFPLKAGAPRRFHAAYRFDDIHLVWPLARGLAFEHWTGELRVSEQGLIGGQARGQLLGGETQWQVVDSGRHPRLSVTGRVTDAGLERWLGPTARRLASGQAAWRADLHLRPQFKWTLESNLQDIAVKLPPPLEKARGEPLALRLDAAPNAERESIVRLVLGRNVYGEFAFKSDWHFSRGRLHVGDGRPSLPSAEGLHLSVKLPYGDGDRWLTYLRANAHETEGADMPEFINRVSADFGTLDIFERSLGAVRLALRKEAANWSGHIMGDTMNGEVFLGQAGGERVVQLNLKHFNLPRQTRAARARAPAPQDPRAWPTLSVRAENFRYGEWDLGKLALWATPVTDGWKIRHLVTSRPEMNMFMKADWHIADGVSQSTLEAEVRTQDIGQTLAALGIPDQVRGGRAEIHASARWAGGLTDYSLANIDAEIRTNAHDGQFLQIKQGAGKLLGLFDLSSLARYLSFDFRSLFGKGYTFDSLDGTLTIKAGNAATPGINIKGPSADLQIRGRTGLLAEDFDLQVGVVPHLRGSLALAGTIAGGPIGLGAALLFERIWKKQIRQGTRMEYIVQGTWADPKVERVIKEPRAELRQ